MDKLRREDPAHKCTGYQHQFNILDHVTPSPTEVNCSIALKNPLKNRGDKYLPGVFVTTVAFLQLMEEFLIEPLH